MSFIRIDEMQNWIKYLLIFCSVLWGCHKNHSEPIPWADRTVLVYMVAENSLNGWTTRNLEKMLKTFQGEGNLLVYIDGYGGEPRLVKLVMNANGAASAETVKTYPARNSASPGILKQTIDEVCSEYPASSYGLVLWSHGTGWLPSTTKSRAFGQDGNNWMELNDLVSALPDERFDFILFDACYMGCVEVAYALRNKTEYMISSPTEIWEDGFPYDEVIGNWWGGEEDYREICRKYYDFYNARSGIMQSGTISLVKTESMDALAEATRVIVEGKSEQIAALDRNAIQRIDRSGSLNWRNILYDFDDYISHLSPTEEQYGNFSRELNNVILYEAHTPSYGNQIFYRKFCGLCSYIPQSAQTWLNTFYAGLEWTKTVYGDQSE